MDDQKIPLGWNITAHQKWLLDNKRDAIQELVSDINKYEKKKPRAIVIQMAYYLFFISDYQSCCHILKDSLDSYPDDVEILQNLSVALSKSGEYAEAILHAEKVISLDSGNFLVCDSLASSCFRVGALEKASIYGTKSLILKDCKYGKIDKSWKLPKCSPSQFAQGKKKVISFSLWGNNKRYLFGALRNVLLAPDIYPDWELWFHTDDSVPLDFLNLIEKLGGKIIRYPNQQSLKEKLCWRFSVANAVDVGYFLVRDIDSVISVREYNAVQKWMETEKWFHVIRDWWTHTDLVLAGLWGGVAGVLPDLDLLLANYKSGNVDTANIDQWFLRDSVWRYIKVSCFIHDRCFSQEGSVPLPGVLPQNNIHVGCCEFSQRPDFQEKILAPWIDKLNMD